ncbi:hypothetical protein [Halogranum amylolyticum]|nr:hypothetical protein [Halogranum amylolyticum]
MDSTEIHETYIETVGRADVSSEPNDRNGVPVEEVAVSRRRNSRN